MNERGNNNKNQKSFSSILLALLLPFSLFFAPPPYLFLKLWFYTLFLSFDSPPYFKRKILLNFIKRKKDQSLTMVFSSIPLYLDPHNWQQQQIQNQAGGQHGNSCETPPQLSLPPQPPSQFPGSSGSIRPGSMTDRARLAKLPQPEAGLKCPRCESTNTKFCYFNNYNHSQPRHFCKTCRRYWTKGGALRNVPVGGGCRRNKRSKSSSKSPITTSTIDRQTGPNITTSPSPISSSSNTDQIATNFTQPPPHFPLITSLQGLSQYSSGNLGLSFGGTIVGGSQSELGFQVGSSNNNNTNSDHQQVQNFSNFLSGFDSSNSGLYQFQTEGTEPPSQPSSSVLGNAQQLRYLPSSSSAQDGQKHQLSSQAKSEENQQGLNLSSRPFTSMAENTQYWAGNNSWMNNFSGLNSSSSSHFS